ncbi:unnamed protein product [Linum tenue]|uniref:Uncharacterized protein n=1 Tax=Linum tenue TaxID=586396 RepID=A0AAV0Q362_9ROSI|nr:unnamed protein product [Linum tenue]
MEVNRMRDLDSEKQLWSGHCRVSRLWLGVNVTTDKVLHLDLILLDSKVILFCTANQCKISAHQCIGASQILSPIS